MHLYIKNMVCDRCILVVQQELQKLNMVYSKVILGEAELRTNPNAETLQQLEKNLSTLGFELLDDSKKQLIEKIKTTVIQHIHHSQEQQNIKFSEFISNALHKDYSSISKLFSEVEGITLEQYLLRQKIERVKELIVYDECSLSQIAFDMGYSSVAHLSSQFKKITGLTPSHFKKIGGIHRNAIDRVSEKL
jgi:AraC family transcriptional regulator